MKYRRDDDDIDDQPRFRLGQSVLRATLLFSSAGIAFALILVPIANRLLRNDNFSPHGIDHTATGSIERPISYTVRRTVLQDKGATCIIGADGRRSGGC